jgi:hypothetical protein
MGSSNNPTNVDELLLSRVYNDLEIFYLKFWLDRFYIQNTAECTILRPSYRF